MSYPTPTYAGDGDVSATHRPADAPPDLALATTAGSYLATGATTDGRFGLYRWEMGPEPSGAGPHFHRSFSESFYVLSGTVSVYDGRAWADARPGDFVHVPDGGVHGFRNESGAPASMLIHFAPGAPREAYFEGLAELAEGRWKPSEEEFRAFLERHDNIFVDER